VRVVGHLQDATPPELILLAVKGHDTQAAATDLAHHLENDTQVVALQNGSGHIATLQEALGPRRVMAGTVFIGAQVSAPGVIRHSAAGFIRLGRYPHGGDPDLTQVVTWLADHDIRVTESATIAVDMWKKLLWNVGFNGPSALSGATVGAMLDQPGVAGLIQRLITEAAAVARADGVPLKDGIEDKTFAQVKGLADFKTSMLQDVLAGRPIENEPFYGFLLQEGEKLAIPTPSIRLVHDLLALRFAETN